MNFTRLYLSTLVPQIPKIINDNFGATSNYMDVFYNASTGVIIKPVNTTGLIKGTTGQFVNVITDNLTVKRQFTNWYNNTTTIDGDFTSTYNGNDVSTRLATSDPSSLARWRPSDGSILIDPSTTLWPLEPSAYSWVNIVTPYIKITNDVSYGLQNNNLGQEVRIIFNLDVSTTAPYTILMAITDVSEGTEQVLAVDYNDASTGTWIKLITIGWDASAGPSWIVKESGGTYTIS